MPTDQNDLSNANEPLGADRRLDDWLQGLRGEVPADAASDAYQFGAQLREKVQSGEFSMKPTSSSSDEALIARWRAEGMFRGRRTLRSRTRAKLLATVSVLQAYWRWVLPATAVALVSLFFVPWGQHQTSLPSVVIEGDEMILKGAEQAQRLRVAEPSKTADQIQSVCAHYGLRSSRANLSGGTVQVQAFVPVDSSAARSEIQALGVPIPDHGRLNLLLVPGP